MSLTKESRHDYSYVIIKDTNDETLSFYENGCDSAGRRAYTCRRNYGRGRGHTQSYGTATAADVGEEYTSFSEDEVYNVNDAIIEENELPDSLIVSETASDINTQAETVPLMAALRKILYLTATRE